MNNSIFFRSQTINYIERASYWQSIERGEWEPASFDVLDMYIVPGKIFIDIGAWVGALTIYAAKKGAKCYAIEADNKAVMELINSITENDFMEQVNFFPLAISDKSGTTEINSMTLDGLGNNESSLIDRGTIGQHHKVLCMTLPDFINRQNINPANICLIKIDTEGSEVLIIPGAIDWLKKYKPTIYISFHPAWFPDLQQAIEIFTNLFSIYNFIGISVWGKIYNYLDFAEAMHTSGEHSFILKAK